jgi:hypothetical protein
MLRFRLVRAITLVVAACATGCALERNPEFYREDFAFAVISDWDGDTAQLRKVVCRIRDLPDVELVFGAGDIPDHAAVREFLRDCGCAGAPATYFPVVGELELAGPNPVPGMIDTLHSDTLEGMTAFERGPDREGGGPSNGYAFEYRGARFTVVDTFDLPHAEAGIEAGAAQLQWLEGLPIAAAERPTFVFGHVPLSPPRYLADGDVAPFLDAVELAAQDLTPVLAGRETTVYFHGHDNIPARTLLDASGTTVFSWTPDDYLDLDGTPQVKDSPEDGLWRDDYRPQAQLWQVGVGVIQAAGNGPEGATHVVTRVTPQGVSLEIRGFGPGVGSFIADHWTIAR